MNIAQSLELGRAQALGYVLQCGQMEGLWTTFPVQDGVQTYRTVETRNGNCFELYHRDGKFGARVASIGEFNAMRTTTTDVRMYSTDEGLAPTAECSADKDPAKVARELSRRLVNEPKAQEWATRVRTMHADRCARRDWLHRTVHELRAEGYRTNGSPNDGEHVEIAMYGPSDTSLHALRINAGGNAYVERLTLDVRLLPELLALVRRHDALSRKEG